MKKARFMMVLSMAVVCLAACKKYAQPENVQGEVAGQANHGDHDEDGSDGFVYTLSNDVSGNNVMEFRRTQNGQLTFAQSFATGGTGTGTGLGNQGALNLSEERNWLFAVNAGNNSISAFSVENGGLTLRSTVPSGGTTPISITSFRNLVYVVNTGGDGNISGFRLYSDGSLHAIPNSTRPLSSNNAGPAEISFVEDGSAVVVTEKNENKILTYTINGAGVPGAMHTLNAANTTPFGFAVGRFGLIYVSEAAGGAPGASTVSSYRVRENGSIVLVDGPNRANQTSACWVAVTGNGRFVFDSNTGSGTVSSFTANPFGGLHVLEAVAGPTGPGSAPADAAFNKNSKFLFIRTGGNGMIREFSVDGNGHLTFVQDVSGLPGGATGLVAQ
jgi:6-phosphogluconolactonase (cycloisomerase 2 family)